MEQDKVDSFVRKKLNAISNLPESQRKAVLANLRKGAGKMPGSVPYAWSEILSDMPETFFGYGMKPSYAEWAVYTALTVYAIHQQGKDSKNVNMDINDYQQSVGKAIARLVHSEEDEKRIIRKLDALVSVKGMLLLSNHLRGIVQLLKREDIPLDYAKLAKDILFFQIEDGRKNIAICWGRDFYRERNRSRDTENENGEIAE